MPNSNILAISTPDVASFDADAFSHQRFKVFTAKQLNQIPQLQKLTPDQRFEMQVVASVLPFRVNQYVIDELINWQNVPSDPIFQLTFPQRGMLKPEHYDRVADALIIGTDQPTLKSIISEVRAELNPHPAGQLEHNIPKLDGEVVEGLQHKYRETVLFFPSSGQVCHSYCTFCFRWAQFVGDKDLKIAARESTQLQGYLREHPEVTDILVTGGDPLVMKTRNLRAYLEPLLTDEFAHVRTIRIGTKALTFWPQRVVTDDDAEDLLALAAPLEKSGYGLYLKQLLNEEGVVFL